MAHPVTKKVRLDADHARRLAELAKSRGVTESDVSRHGIDLVEQMQHREKALERLIELSAVKGPAKETYRFR